MNNRILERERDKKRVRESKSERERERVRVRESNKKVFNSINNKKLTITKNRIFVDEKKCF